MALRDLFSKRRARAARAGQTDVYQYEQLPEPFRVQVVHIWQRALGEFIPMNFSPLNGGDHSVWSQIETDVAEEHGVFRLGEEREAFSRVANYFLKAGTPLALDVIEVVFDSIDRLVRQNLHYSASFVKQHPDDAIADLNLRFREHSIGFQYTDGQIIRVDSQYLHAEAVKPALALLQTPGFAGPQEEFLKAHAHYREGKHKEAINEALKAFESTLKAICAQRKWTYNTDRDTAKSLLDIVLREELVPSYLQNAFGGLRSVLEGAVPTMRNRTSGHGQGPTPTEVPEHLAAYVLHVTAATVVFLVNAHLAKT